jgi:predicted DNA-binding helix-hairpin-helix protein
MQRATGAATPLLPARRPVRITGMPAPFAPAGQSTQLIVGATDASDATILDTASTLYQAHRLRRVYYSAFSPIPDASDALPPVAPPLVREHRLYQADWLVRFYGFDARELTTAAAPNLDLELDPKTAWALRHRELFPVDVNRAPRELLLRIPGVGARSVTRMLSVRRWRQLRVADLAALRVTLRRALPFVVTADGAGSAQPLDAADLRTRLLGRRTQLDLFAPPPATVGAAARTPLVAAPQASRRSVLFGEL